ncbi:hypothetical protein G7Y89_g5613 [Cudoniella acicularis]|uniref:Uncharacterized protein n=1 Tax=Cudoniella acicularis TaxID=354080 RepID=A0A8H4RPC3_9HELO|nr:hypothetical protein G7Y89_g5613 [Cudoniella acicularis]
MECARVFAIPLKFVENSILVLLVDETLEEWVLMEGDALELVFDEELLEEAERLTVDEWVDEGLLEDILLEDVGETVLEPFVDERLGEAWLEEVDETSFEEELLDIA